MFCKRRLDRINFPTIQMKNQTHKIKFWGVRGSFPSPRKDTVIFGGHTSCVEIRTAKNELIVLDMGTGFLDLGSSLMSEPNAPKDAHIIVSHFHWDHLFGFLGFTPFFDPNRAFHIYGKDDKMSPEEIINYIQHPTFWPVSMDMLNAKIDLHVFPHDELVISDDIKIKFTLHGHPNGANSYRIEIGNSVIVYSTDCEHPSTHLNHHVIENAQDADVLIHDAQYTDEELPAHKGWGHSSWQQAVAVAKVANVKQLVLYHHDPARNDDAMYQLETDAQGEFPNTLAARQGMEIHIPASY